MAFDKKNSSYSDSGKVRSAEELETYGVWVKSEPQDVASEMANAVDFGEDAVPFEAGFNMGFGGMEVSDADVDSSDMGFGSFGDDDFDDGSFVSGPFEKAEFTESGFDDADFDESDTDADVDSGAAPADEEMSSKILLKIADELTSIRSELDTLKKEFAEIRGAGAETFDGGFFSGEDDGKIALTDSEMDDILASSFSVEHSGLGFGGDDAFDALRDEDEAALKELSRQNETKGPRDEGEWAGEETGFPFGLDDGPVSVDADDTDDGENAETDMQDRMLGAETDNVFDTDLDFLTGESDADRLGIGEDDIFRVFADELPSPDMLEDVDELRDLRMHGADPLTPPPENSDYLEEDPFSLTGDSDDELSDEGGAGFGGFEVENTFRFDENMPLNDEFIMEDLSAGDALDEEASEGESLLDDDLTDELAAIDETLPLDDEVPQDDELAELTVDIDEEEAPVEMEMEGGISLDDDTSFPGDAPLLDTAAPLADDMPLEDTSLLDEEMVFDLDDGEFSEDDEPLVAEAAETPADFLESSSDELMLDEPIFEDISLAMDDMESFDIDDPAFEDSNLMREIPEGFQVDAEEALVSDDDLEAIAEDGEIPQPPADKPESPVAKENEAEPDIDFSPDLKKDLKDVLFYMDQLLESLPEDKIEEFAKSDHFDTYRKLFKELGLVQ